jgi:murein DD-endopeptidase MepM/ murein hydrolase activator NlpD
MRRLFVALGGLAALASIVAGPSSSAVRNKAWAHAVAVKIVVPGKPVEGTTPVAAPPDGASLAETYAYPEDGSLVSTGALSATVSTNVAPQWADGQGSSEISSLKLFEGEVTATKLSVRALAGAGPKASSGGTGGARILGLSVLGQPVTPSANLKVPLADWGYVVVLEQRKDSSAPPGRTRYRTWVSALDVHLTAAHGGLPAGSQIVIGSSDAGARAKAAPRPHVRHRKEKPPAHHTEKKHQARQHHRAARSHPSRHSRTTTPARRVKLKAPEPKLSPFGPLTVQSPPKHHKVHPQLTGSGYVFPVFGPSSFTDTFGAARADTGWHHGDDIFAPLGAPVLAVAKGTIFSVGWNDLGGNRLWLADTHGNQFYYAHLSAFSPLAVNGARVSAGDVLGFVGNTGDAEGTPYHLHFEIHPRSLLGQGYDGVIDPTSYLQAWKHLRDLAFSNVSHPGGENALAARPVRNRAPEPGAILLHVADISSAPSLDYESVKKALGEGGYPTAKEGDNLLVGSRSSSG